MDIMNSTISLAPDGGHLPAVNEVVQVIVLHLDLFTCGTCGKQSTDILEHILHKSQHKVSELFTCELCKLVVPSHCELFLHYNNTHGIKHGIGGLLSQPGSLLPQTGGMVSEPHTESIVIDKSLSMTWNSLTEAGGKSPVDQMEQADVLYQVDEMMKQEVREGMEMGEDSTVSHDTSLHGVPSSTASKTRARSLLTAAKKMLNATRRDNALKSPSPVVSATVPSRRPSILRSPHKAKHRPRQVDPAIAIVTGSNQSPVQCIEIIDEGGTQSEAKCKQAKTATHAESIDAPIPNMQYTNEHGGSLNMKHKAKQPETITVIGGDSGVGNVQYLIKDEMSINAQHELSVTTEQCLHCDFSTTDKNEFTLHMKMKHKLLEFPGSLEIVTEEKSPDKKDMLLLYGAKTKHKPLMSVDDGGEVKHFTSPVSSPYKKQRKPRGPRKVERQDLPGVYPCNQCGKSFMRLRYLRKHAHVHNNAQSYVCQECGKLFKCKGYLRVHMRKHEDEEERSYRCNECDFTSNINAAIHAHRQIHSQGSVLCDTCGYAYTDKATLAKHKRVHDPNRPFACAFPGCTWRFMSEVMCKAHVRAHTTEGKFACAYCGYIFRHKHHLQRHELNMHGIQRDKSRSYTPKSIPRPNAQFTVSEIENSVNIIIGGDLETELQNGMTEQYLVIEPEPLDSTDIYNQTYTLQSEDIHVQTIQATQHIT